MSPAKGGARGGRTTTSTSSRPSTSPASSGGGRHISTERLEQLTGRKSHKRQADEDQFGGGGSDTLRRDMKRRASQQDREAKEQYEASGELDRDQAKAKAADKRTTKAKSSAKRQGRKVTRAAKRPVAAASSGTVIGLLVGSLGLVLLLNFLRSADKAAGFLSGIRTAVDWIADPTKVIEYKGGG